MLYKNTKVKFCSLDGDMDYFDLVAGVLQGDTLSPYLFIICLDYLLRIALLANSSTQATGGIGFHVNAVKTEYMYFYQRSDISTRMGGPLKLVDTFTHLGRSVSSNKECHQHATSKGMEIYLLAIGHMEVRTDR